MTVTVYVPESVLLVAEIESVDDAVPPDNPTGLTLNEVPRPGEETEAVRLTKQQNPFKPESAIVVVENDPTWTVRLVGLGAMVKSVTTITSVEEWAKDPLVPVTVKENVPAAAAVRVNVAEIG